MTTRHCLDCASDNSCVIVQLRVCVHGVCVFTAVCVHFGWVKCRARIPSMSHHTWSYVTSLSLIVKMRCDLKPSVHFEIFFFQALTKIQEQKKKILMLKLAVLLPDWTSCMVTCSNRVTSHTTTLQRHTQQSVMMILLSKQKVIV